MNPLVKAFAAYVIVLAAGLSVDAQPPAIPHIPIGAAEGDFDPPLSIVPKSGAAVYVPPVTVVDAKYIGLDGEEAFDVTAFGGNKVAFVLITRGLPPGKVYRFAGVGSDKDGKITRKDFSVTIPGPAPVPPGPTPVPPGPAPVPPPSPVFPPDMRTKLQAAFASDTGDAAAKEDLRRQLRVLYEQAVITKVAADPKVTGSQQLIDKMRESAASLTSEQLYNTRLLIGTTYISPLLLPDAPLTDDKRAAAHTLFQQLAAAIAW